MGVGGWGGGPLGTYLFLSYPGDLNVQLSLRITNLGRNSASKRFHQIFKNLKTNLLPILICRRPQNRQKVPQGETWEESCCGEGGRAACLPLCTQSLLFP